MEVIFKEFIDIGETDPHGVQFTDQKTQRTVPSKVVGHKLFIEVDFR